MTRQQKILLAFLGTILVIGLAVGAWWWMRQRRPAPAAPVVTGPVTNNAPTTIVPVVTPQPPQPAGAEEIARSQLTTSGKQFAERYGSFSSDGDYQNLTDLFPLMTAGMQRTAEATIAAGQRQPAPPEFTGVTTVAASTKVTVLDLASGRATVEVRAQRQSTVGTQKTNSYETLTLSFVRSGTVWKVNAATWKK